MPGTTRYSATFDRPYEEEVRTGTDPTTTTANGSRRSRSQSWQANLDERPYTPLGNSRLSHRSSSTDSGASKGVANIPTRTTSKAVVKTHNNPFQFVKVGSSPLYRKAEEQLKKVKEVKKPEVLKEEEEEWQTNLDSWKSRRRKMSEDVFKRQEEIRQFEMEEQSLQAIQKKTKTFSEMVESRAHRGRTLSLCLISSPLDLQKWELENSNTSNSSHPFSEGSEENSAFNSEDEGVSDKRNTQKNDSSNCSNENGSHFVKNGLSNTCKNKTSRLLELSENCSPLKEGIYIDSGLESISSSHRTGDTPDSCSDFSQDSGSSIDCDSPRVSGLIYNGVNVLEDFNPKSVHMSDSNDSSLNMKTTNSNMSFAKDTNESVGTSVSDGESICMAQETCDISKSNYSSTNSSPSSQRETNGESSTLQKSVADTANSVDMVHKKEKSVESENEVFVDDFEELNPSVKTFTPNNQESSVKNEAPQTDLPSSEPTKSVKSACTDSTVGPPAESSRKKQKNDSPSVEENSVSKLPHLDDDKLPSFNKEKAVSKSHSQEKIIDSAVKEKEPKKKLVKKKKIKAKVVSVETSTQKSNASTTQNECSGNLNLEEESLNVVFQSQPLNSKDSQANSNCELKRSYSNSKESILLNDVLPVEKVAEEMEKLILQQLEDEERAKEFSSKMVSANLLGSPEHNLIAPPREPPKEKPPPPPSADNDGQKPTSLKRINSTKRIKKEIHKRRSNFLGIENTDENLGCETSVPPPPALEQILKAEMELDRESMKRLENAATQRIKLEERDLIEKEREIIETLETEERQKNLMNNEEVCNIMLEEDRIQKLMEERKRMENERVVTEAQRLRLEEEKQLKEREEYVKKQEVDNSSSAEISSSEVPNKSNTPTSSIASLCTETKANGLLSNIGGEGETISNSASQILDPNSCAAVGKPSVPSKPAVPPKPLKKKEAIRKERERLRQEQEALQREREEHRQKLLLEQEEVIKSQQKTHAPSTPVSRIGPPSPLKPTHVPQLTNSVSAPPCAKENVNFPSQSFHVAQNGISSGTGCADPVVNQQSKPALLHKKPVLKEPWVQQKVPSVKKQSHDPIPESKYNQNHWLIQEAEMRRISELKERQHSAHFPSSQTHLAGDDVCSNSPLVPTILPPNGQPNPPLQDKVWSYRHAKVAMKKYPPPVSTDKPPSKPSRVVPLERPEQMLSVSGRKPCSHCGEELGRGAAMIIESLELFYHIHCFQCCVCQAQLGNGSCGTDVRVRNNKLHCHNCYSNDEFGLKFSQV